MVYIPISWLAFFQWRLRRLFDYFDSGHAQFKAMVVVCCLQAAAVFAALSLTSIAAGRKLLPGSRLEALILFAGLGFLIVRFNLFKMQKCGYWSRYTKEFEETGPAARVIGTIASIVVILFGFGGMLYLANVVSRLPT